jgi:methionine-R-sulfoxide reductase
LDSTPDLDSLVGELAPELGVNDWRDAAGQPLATWGLAQMPGAWKLVFCFQDHCPGCHRSGFPTLQRVAEAFRGSRFVSFAAVQTVFEDFEQNSAERGYANQARYALTLPFGHDAGAGSPDAGKGAGSVLMQRYRSGGTPWFILVDPQGVVAFSDFHLDADRLISFLKQAEAEARQHEATAADPSVLTWRGVLLLARDGNPAPPRRVELSEAQWRERLSADQFHVMREHGTERAHSSAMCALFEPGRYHCAGCGTELFDAGTKFDSRSGWPSFTQAIAPDRIAYRSDRSHGMQRIETLCNVCDAHLGHVFPDGPAPSGLRYCINALALNKG